MNHINDAMNRLSLLYFALLGLLCYFAVAPILIPLAILSLFFPKCMDLYYFVILYAIKIYIKLSPLKYRQKDINILSQIDQRKCFIICNHRSHLDMFLFLSNVYKVRAVANAYLVKIPLLGQVMRMSGQIAVETGNIKSYKKMQIQITEALKRKDKILFFPEIKRCLPGFKGIQKFRMTVFQLAREHNVEIIPVVVSGTDKVWPKGKRSTDFSHKISIKALSPINPNHFKDTASLSEFVHELMQEELRMISL